MNTEKRFVLSCIDGSDLSEAVCDYAAWIGQSVDAPVKFLHTLEQHNIPVVADLTGSIGLGASEELLNELTEVEQNRTRLLIKKGNIMLQAAKQRALEAGVETVKLRQRHGNLTEALVDMEEQIRVLVVGIRGEQHQADEAGVGTQLETIVRSLHKPILVVNQDFVVPRKIMLAYDGSEAANKALQMLVESPLFKNTVCHLVHVTHEQTDKDEVLEQGAKQLTAAGIAVTTASLNGRIEKVLTDYQAEQDIDLTLMGAFSHNRVRDFLLGSFTAKMLESTQRPLLLLR